MESTKFPKQPYTIYNAVRNRYTWIEAVNEFLATL